MKPVERIEKENAREYALRAIKENVISLELEPGSLVSEKEVADVLGLSRTPVREAFIELGRTNIIEIYPQRGSYVSKIDYELVEEAGFTRRVLESAIVELLCTMDIEDQVAKLNEIIHLQQFYMDEGNPSQLMKQDNLFHKMLFILARKPQTYELMESMEVHFDRVRNMSLQSEKHGGIIADHKEIVQAVRDKDAEKAKRLMTEHLFRYKVDEKALRKQYPQYFK